MKKKTSLKLENGNIGIPNAANTDQAAKLQRIRIRSDGSDPSSSIIIPVFNNVEHTQKCLGRLKQLNTKHPSDIIIIDNASSDGTGLFLKDIDGIAHVITNAKNRGFGAACNQGASVSRSKYLVFLNNDTLPDPAWLDALIDMMEQDTTIGAAGSRLVYPDGRLQEAGGLVFQDASGWNFGHSGDPDAPQFTEPCEVDYCSGAALIIRRELFERLGGFDPRYAPAYYEDTDICFGVRSLGYKVMYCPHATVIHHGGATGGVDESSGLKRYQTINRWKFAAKWASALAEQEPPPSRTGRRPETADRRRLARANQRKRNSATVAIYRFYYSAKALLARLSQGVTFSRKLQ
jgi:O-antigen biosynthesis protein